MRGKAGKLWIIIAYVSIIVDYIDANRIGRR